MAEGGEVIFKFLGDDTGLKKTMGTLGSIGQKALKGLLAGTAVVSAGFAGIVTASVKARGEMEQLEGGIKKLFGSDFQAVMDNANKAFKTAGVSASDYLDQVTSFSASLITSLNGDTKEATRIANRAIIDMADNANTFGTSMESIQNAYQGFAKQNYTMLDNLKLGYAGTKEGMKKLISDASKMKDIQRELNLEVQNGDMSFSNIAKAISVVQKSMNIMDTTMKEAEGTLTGSISTLKASWQNFLAGTGSLSDVVDSASIALDNILRIVDEALPDIINQVNANMPKIMELGGKILNAMCDGIIEYMPQILDVVVTIVEKISDALLANSDKLGDIAFKLMEVFAVGIIKALPRIIIAMGKIGLGIIESITKLNGDIWVAGYELLLKFIEGVKSRYQQVQTTIEAIKIVIKTAFDRLKQQASNWGVDFLSNFANGIMQKLAHLREVVANVANSIRSHLHFSRPDEGPLRDYETWMPDMIKGMANSLEKAMPMLTNKVNDLALSMSPTLNGEYNSMAPSVNVVVQNSYESDPLGQMVNQIKTFSNGAKNDYNYGYGG